MRRGAVGLLLALLTLWSAASAAEGGRPSPRGALLMSTVLPGWGQAANGHPVKGAVCFAAGAGLVGSYFIESRRADRALQKARAATTNAEYLAYYDDYARHFDRRDNVLWWGVFFWLYAMVDAYVDAHLTGFDEPFENEPAGDRIRPWIGAGEPGVRVGIRVRLP